MFEPTMTIQLRRPHEIVGNEWKMACRCLQIVCMFIYWYWNLTSWILMVRIRCKSKCYTGRCQWIIHWHCESPVTAYLLFKVISLEHIRMLLSLYRITWVQRLIKYLWRLWLGLACVEIAVCTPNLYIGRKTTMEIITDSSERYRRWGVSKHNSALGSPGYLHIND